MSELRFERVTVRYGSGRHAHVAVDSVDLVVPSGHVVGLVGESGSGKSTLARAAVGLVTPAAGRILLDGKPVPTRGRRPLQMVFQDPYASLDPRMTAGESIAEAVPRGTRLPRAAARLPQTGTRPPRAGTHLPQADTRSAQARERAAQARERTAQDDERAAAQAGERAAGDELPAAPGERDASSAPAGGKLSGAGRHAEAERLAELVGLPPGTVDKFPGELSGGQRQRVALARALAGRPSVIIADEITSALDVSTQGAVLNLVRELQRELRLSMLFISHNLAVVRYVADYVAVMAGGRIVEHGPAGQVLLEPAHDYTRELLAAVPRPGTRIEPETPVAPETRGVTP